MQNALDWRHLAKTLTYAQMIAHLVLQTMSLRQIFFDLKLAFDVTSGGIRGSVTVEYL